MRHLTALGFALSLTLVSASALASEEKAAPKADAAAGKTIATQVCAACHGADGNSAIPANPKLAGQHRDFLERALLDYKAGGRKNAIMSGQSQPLTKAEIANLAAFYASLPGSLRDKR